MRTLAILVALPLMACSCTGESSAGVPGTGSGTSRSYAVGDFSTVALRGADDVDVRVGTAFSVRAEGPSDELDKLVIERDGDTLKVGRRDSSGIGWGSGSKVRVHVTMPRIAGAALGGSGNMTIDRAEGSAFKAASAGSGNLSIAALAVGNAKFSLAGSGAITAGGTTGALDVSIAGSGDVTAKALKATSARISIAGSGSVTAAVTGPAKVSIVGSGDVDLGPGAQCKTSRMGSGDVRCGG